MEIDEKFLKDVKSLKEIIDSYSSPSVSSQYLMDSSSANPARKLQINMKQPKSKQPRQSSSSVSNSISSIPFNPKFSSTESQSINANYLLRKKFPNQVLSSSFSQTHTSNDDSNISYSWLFDDSNSKSKPNKKIGKPYNRSSHSTTSSFVSDPPHNKSLFFSSDFDENQSTPYYSENETSTSFAPHDSNSGSDLEDYSTDTSRINENIDTSSFLTFSDCSRKQESPSGYLSDSEIPSSSQVYYSDEDANYSDDYISGSDMDSFASHGFTSTSDYDLGTSDSLLNSALDYSCDYYSDEPYSSSYIESSFN